MIYERIEIDYHAAAIVIRFRTPCWGARYDGVELRDEIAQLVQEHPGYALIVDFGDYQLYPAEILACLAHARQFLRSDDLIRCVKMPLRLQVACRFLRLNDSLFEHCESVDDAIQAAEDEALPLFMLAWADEWTYAA